MDGQDSEPRYVMNMELTWEEHHAEFMKRQMKMMDETINAFSDPVDRFLHHVENQPDKPFILFKDRCYTFKDTNNRVNQVARALTALGVTKEGGVAMVMKNKPEFLFNFLACLKLHTTISLINYNLRTKSLLHCINEGESTSVIVDDDKELLGAVDEIRDELRSRGIRVFVDGRRQLGFNSLQEVADDQSTDEIHVEESDDVDFTELLGCYIFTSGTTGLPKAVRIPRYRYGVMTAFFTIANMRLDDILYVPLPLYHTSALFCFCVVAMYTGVTVALAEKFSAHYFFEDCQRMGATVVQYIGETCRYLLTTTPSPSDKQHRIRVAIGNGLKRDIWADFQNRFNIPEVVEFFGATDGNVALINITGKLGACGRRNPALNDVEGEQKMLILDYDTENDLVIRDSNGLCKTAPVGKPGLFVTEITPLARFSGYHNPKQTEKRILRNVLVEGDQYVNYGDLLVMDSDFYFYFVDRIGDTFRWKGENVSTQEVADVISDLSFIDDCCVYGVKIPGKDGRCGMAALVLAPGTAANEETMKALYDRCHHYLPSYARPLFIRFMKELHLTGTYKYQRFKLQSEGYDINSLSDVFFLDEEAKSYVPLTKKVYQSIITGSIKAHL